MNKCLIVPNIRSEIDINSESWGSQMPQGDKETIYLHVELRTCSQKTTFYED